MTMNTRRKIAAKTKGDTKEEEDLERRDLLLEELKVLQRAHPNDPAVQEIMQKRW